jgi:hypothetical protein
LQNLAISAPCGFCHIFRFFRPSAVSLPHERNLVCTPQGSYNGNDVREYLNALLEWSGAGEQWQPLPRWAIAAWLAFYLVFMAYAFSMHGGYLFIDSANLVVHEGGHLLFGWFGRTIGLWGGTILQWLVPLLLSAYFFHVRQPAGFVFCLFFFFENWLYTATYMADARAMALPLVTTGDPEFVEHDWNTIFSSLGLLPYDTAIATVVRLAGWAGMLGSVAWLANRIRKAQPVGDHKLGLDQSWN